MLARDPAYPSRARGCCRAEWRQTMTKRTALNAATPTTVALASAAVTPAAAPSWAHAWNPSWSQGILPKPGESLVAQRPSYVADENISRFTPTNLTISSAVSADAAATAKASVMVFEASGSETKTVLAFSASVNPLVMA